MHYWPVVRETTGDRLIPITNGLVMQKAFPYHNVGLKTKFKQMAIS